MGNEYIRPILQLPFVNFGSDFVFHFCKHVFVFVPVSQPALLNIPDLSLSRDFFLPRGLNKTNAAGKREVLI